jgi:methylthioribose-1-phosphate isomerase
MTDETSQDLRAVEWTREGLSLIDQTVLPARLDRIVVREVDQLVDAIVRLVVRGAPAIGAAGAYGVAIALLQGEREGWTRDQLLAAVARIREARPTAVNLAVCVDRVASLADQGLAAVLAEADAVVREDLQANHDMGVHGADWLLKRTALDRPLRILTHCNTGALATAGWGTGLGVIRELHSRPRTAVPGAGVPFPAARRTTAHAP